MPTSTSPVRHFWFIDNQTFNSSGQSLSHTNSSGVRILTSDSVSKPDPANRRFKDLIRDGQCATTDMSGSETVILASPYSSESELVQPQNRALTYRRYVASGILNLSVNSNGTSYPSAEAENQSLTKFYQHAQEVETQFKGTVFLGELMETLHMIRHPARTLRRGMGDYLQTLRKRSRRTPKPQRLKMVRDTWLEYALGWLPLVKDIDDGIKAFYGGPLIRPIFKMVRGKGSASIKDPTTFNTLQAGLGASFNFYSDIERFTKAHYKHYGIYQSVGNGIGNSHHYGFRPNEFVPTIYELIPYSFLVDYFTNLGNILESWSYRSQNLKWLSRGILHERTLEMTNPRPTIQQIGQGYTNSILQFNPGSYLATTRTIQRTAVVGFTLPSLELKLPGRWQQWVTTAFLLSDVGRTKKVLLR